MSNIKEEYPVAILCNIESLSTLKSPSPVAVLLATATKLATAPTPNRCFRESKDNLHDTQHTCNAHN